MGSRAVSSYNGGVSWRLARVEEGSRSGRGCRPRRAAGERAGTSSAPRHIRPDAAAAQTGVSISPRATARSKDRGQREIGSPSGCIVAALAASSLWASVLIAAWRDRSRPLAPEGFQRSLWDGQILGRSCRCQGAVTALATVVDLEHQRSAGRPPAIGRRLAGAGAPGDRLEGRGRQGPSRSAGASAASRMARWAAPLR